MSILAFSFLFSYSFSAYLETGIDRHEAKENDVLNLTYSFNNFHGNGYLRIYAVKCAIGEKINCTFSENKEEALLKELENISFENGYVEILIPNLEFGLYKICSKAYNHTTYATDCDSQKYIMIKNENSCETIVIRDNPDLSVNIVDFPKNVTKNSTFEVIANITNPQSSEKQVEVYSYVYKYNGTAQLVSQYWTQNEKQVLIPAFSTINIALENVILKDVEGDFILKVRIKFDEKERDCEVPLKIEKIKNADLKVVGYTSNFISNKTNVAIEIANYGDALGKINIVIFRENETSENFLELNPKTQKMYYYEINSSKFHIAVMSNTTIFSKYFEFTENKTQENKSYEVITARAVEKKNENAFKDFYILPVIGLVTLLIALVLTR